MPGIDDHNPGRVGEERDGDVRILNDQGPHFYIKLKEIRDFPGQDIDEKLNGKVNFAPIFIRSLRQLHPVAPPGKEGGTNLDLNRGKSGPPEGDTAPIRLGQSPAQPLQLLDRNSGKSLVHHHRRFRIQIPLSGLDSE